MPHNDQYNVRINLTLNKSVMQHLEEAYPHLAKAEILRKIINDHVSTTLPRRETSMVQKPSGQILGSGEADHVIVDC
jgi:hypothetical protein